MIERNVKRYKIAKGIDKIQGILKQEAIHIPLQSGEKPYTYLCGGIAYQEGNDQITIAGKLEVSVNYLAGQLNHCGIKLKQM